jgi:hypothetical protein
MRLPEEVGKKREVTSSPVAEGPRPFIIGRRSFGGYIPTDSNERPLIDADTARFAL